MSAIRNTKPLVILIGASGAGKTTIAQTIEAHYWREVDVLYFDRIGVPSKQEMIREYGSGEAWQRAKTIEWMARLAAAKQPEQRVLFEGQTRLSFLAEGAAAAGGLSYMPVLVDCDDETRIKRLSSARRQPDLASADMMNWARYLRREAQADGDCEILDTSGHSLEDSVAAILALLRI